MEGIVRNMEESEDPNPVVAFCQANGLESSTDFRYAFTSKAEAQALGGKEVAVAWEELAGKTKVGPLPANLRQFLTGLPRLRPAAKVPEPVRPSVMQTEQFSRPNRRRQNQLSDGKDREARILVANQIVKLALSWGLEGRLGQEMQALKSESARKAYVELAVDRIACFETTSLRAHICAWQRWSAWCKLHGESELRPTAVSVPLFLKGQASAVTL